MKISAVVFDMDGTLVESNIAFSSIRKEIGIPERYPILEYIEENLTGETKVEAYNAVHKYESIACKNAKEIRDITIFLNSLKEVNIPTGILTRNSKVITTETLEKFDWNFDLILSRDCAKPKPDPEGLDLFSKKLHIPLKEILYIGDYDFDIETAKNAGAIAGLLLNEKNHYLKESADIIIENYMDLFNKYFG